MKKGSIFVLNGTTMIIGVIFIALGATVLWFGAESAGTSNEEQLSTARNNYVLTSKLVQISQTPIGDTRFSELLVNYIKEEQKAQADPNDIELMKAQLTTISEQALNESYYLTAQRYDTSTLSQTFILSGSRDHKQNQKTILLPYPYGEGIVRLTLWGESK